MRNEQVIQGLRQQGGTIMTDYKLICGFCKHYDGKRVGFCHKDKENKLEALSDPKHYQHHCNDGSVNHSLIFHLSHNGNAVLTNGKITMGMNKDGKRGNF